MERKAKGHVGHTERQWQGKFFACGMRCFYCLTPLTLQEATKDHKLPQSRGGGNRIGNIVPACGDCNSKKGDMTAEEFQAAREKIFTEANFSTVLGTTSVCPASILGELRAEDNKLLQALVEERNNCSWWRTASTTQTRSLGL
jgi:hypothetical protein